MRSAWRVVLVAGMAGGAAGGLEPLTEHVDVVPAFGGGAWSWEIGTDEGSVQPEMVYFPARDSDFPAGERYARPAGSQWDFLGVDEGEPLWILPQSDNGFTWPGFESRQTGTFASYLESDPRAGALAQPWIRIGLVSVDGPGPISLFQFQGGGPVVWMADADGIAPDDLFLLVAGGHSHLNWAFSSKGLYRIRLTAAAYLGPGASNETPAGEPVALHFAVGARAAWRAERFPLATVMDEAVAGDGADPDRDGRVNLLEYAFGSDPLWSSGANPETGEAAGPELRMVEEGGSRYPALRFFRRIHADADVSYTVEWSDGLGSAWTPGGVESSVESFGDTWERVTMRDSNPVGGVRFGRVRVEAGS